MQAQSVNNKVVQANNYYIQKTDSAKETIVQQKNEPDSFRDKLLKPALFASTGLSILASLTLISKGKTGTGKVADFLNNARISGERISRVKDFNMFKPNTYRNLVTKMKYAPLDILTMSCASVTSGLITGSLIGEKRDRKAKLKEAISQIVGNVFIPIGAITAAGALADRSVGKTIFNKVITEGGSKKIKAAATITAFIGGIIVGNKVANMVNRAIFKTDKDKERELGISDMANHVDDLFATAGTVGKGIPAFSHIARVVPAALTIAGVSTGAAGEDTSAH